MAGFFHGSAEMLLATLMEDREFSEAELARMRSILDRAERKGELGDAG